MLVDIQDRENICGKEHLRILPLFESPPKGKENRADTGWQIFQEKTEKSRIVS